MTLGQFPKTVFQPWRFCFRANIIALLVTNLERKITLFFVTGAGVGYIPYIPGTMGTVLAIPFSIGLNRLADTTLAFAALTLAGLVIGAIKWSTKAAEILRQKDPQVIVADEIVGFMIANFLAPARLAPLIFSFILFRFFDIAKVYPASRLEKLPGGAGIVLDDVMAGIYAFVIVQVLLNWELI
jgi:phosphatidylglycerophosphatase A